MVGKDQDKRCSLGALAAGEEKLDRRCYFGRRRLSKGRKRCRRVREVGSNCQFSNDRDRYFRRS